MSLIAGVAFNWSWLAAAGIAPLLIGILPCAAMCALHLCSKKSSVVPGEEHATQGRPAPGVVAADRYETADRFEILRCRIKEKAQ